ncbi:MAG: hypothetical protein ACI9VM_000152 [Candidatus Azotimanducaceae bacterium]|jgi:hypothetical protein
MKNILIALIALVVVGGIGYYLLSKDSKTTVANDTPTTVVEVDDVAEEKAEAEVVTPEVVPDAGPEEVIGTSADDNDVVAYHFGDGDTEVMFVGGVHGGYSFNTALVAFELIDYLKATPDAVPENVRVTVIPVLNPDGLKEVVGSTGRFDGTKVTANDAARVPGRFNANNVDLNRNFDCEWNEEATWQNKSVSGGSSAFSESESAALRDYVEANDPSAVVVYYSQAGGVYSSTCKNGILPETTELTNLYAKASGYPAFEEFDYYEITGDMVNWLAGKKIPAISVLLTNHEESEWTKNKAGIEAVLQNYAQ